MRDVYKDFLNLERPTVDSLNELIKEVGIRNVIIYRPLQIKYELIINMPYFIETENGQYINRAEEIKLVPVFKSKNEYSHNPTDKSIFMYPTELMKEIVLRETGVLDMTRVRVETLRNASFNTYYKSYERIGVIGLVTFFEHKESGETYQFIPELEKGRLDDIFERPNKGLFKVREDQEVNKIIEVYGDITVKYDLSGTEGFKIYYRDKMILKDMWSLDEVMLFKSKIG